MKNNIRYNALNNIYNNFTYNKLYLKLTNAERILLNDFVKKNELLTKQEFELSANRLFMDKVKTKNWIIITDILIFINSQ